MNSKEASDIVEEALNKVVPQMKNAKESDILVEWALIAYVTNPQGNDAYPILYSNGEIPTYRARGLFHTALSTLDNSKFVDGDEGDDND